MAESNPALHQGMTRDNGSQGDDANDDVSSVPSAVTHSLPAAGIHNPEETTLSMHPVFGKTATDYVLGITTAYLALTTAYETLWSGCADEQVHVLRGVPVCMPTKNDVLGTVNAIFLALWVIALMREWLQSLRVLRANGWREVERPEDTPDTPLPPHCKPLGPATRVSAFNCLMDYMLIRAVLAELLAGECVSILWKTICPPTPGNPWSFAIGFYPNVYTGVALFKWLFPWWVRRRGAPALLWCGPGFA